MGHIENDRPGIIASLKTKLSDDIFHILIDGNHRAVKSFREGKEFRVVVLSIEETWGCIIGESRHLLRDSGED